MDQLVYIGLALSIGLNVTLATYFFKRKATTLTVDAKKLLHELTSGPAVIRLEVMDVSQLFLRSPKG